MPQDRLEYLSSVWKEGIFSGKVVFCTGGNGTICSAQVRALVCLGANACIVGRNVKKTEVMAEDIMTARPGSKVIGIGGVDVRSVESLQAAVDSCVKDLGGIDFLMFVPVHPEYSPENIATNFKIAALAPLAISSPQHLS
jgi:2,4-dienoyl-CoA reductase [(3E)-enoyl-CoA-producing], peroxisomal